MATHVKVRHNKEVIYDEKVKGYDLPKLFTENQVYGALDYKQWLRLPRKKMDFVAKTLGIGVTYKEGDSFYLWMEW